MEKIKCNECQSIFELTLSKRHIEDDLYEYGIECPKCKHWYHSFFVTDRIMNLLPKQRRKYTIAIKKLNKKERKKRGLKMIKGLWE